MSDNRDRLQTRLALLKITRPLTTIENKIIEAIKEKALLNQTKETDRLFFYDFTYIAKDIDYEIFLMIMKKVILYCVTDLNVFVFKDNRPGSNKYQYISPGQD